MIKSVMLTGTVTIAGESSQVLNADRWTFEPSKDGNWIRCLEKKEGGDAYDIPREQIRFVRRSKV